MLHTLSTLVLALPAAWSSQDPDTVLTPARVARLRSVTSAVVSPDGSRVAYTLSVPRAPMVDEDGTPWTELHVLDVADSRERSFVGGKAGLSQVRFSKDGRSLFFLEKRADDKFACLYSLPLEGGEARRALKLETAITHYSISPDGLRAAVIATEPENAERKKRADKGFKQEVYEEDFRPARVYVAELFADASKLQPLNLEGSATQVVWSPVDDRLALALAPSPLVDDEMMRSRVHVVDAGSGSGLARFANPGKLGQITWSPDGRHIAFVSAEDPNDTAAGRIFAGASDQDTFTDLLPGYAGHVEKLAWLDSERLAFVAAQGVWSFVGTVGAPGSGHVAGQILGPGGAVMTDLSAADDGRSLALIGSTPSHPPECFTLKLGDVAVGSSRVDLQACKLEYSIVSPK